MRNRCVCALSRPLGRRQTSWRRSDTLVSSNGRQCGERRRASCAQLIKSAGLGRICRLDGDKQLCSFFCFLSLSLSRSPTTAYSTHTPGAARIGYLYFSRSGQCFMVNSAKCNKRSCDCRAGAEILSSAKRPTGRLARNAEELEKWTRLLPFRRRVHVAGQRSGTERRDTQVHLPPPPPLAGSAYKYNAALADRRTTTTRGERKLFRVSRSAAAVESCETHLKSD